MAQPVKDNRIILEEAEAQAQLLEGAKASYEVVTTTFGPKGKNVLIEKPFGRPILTRDGVTVAREVYFKDRAKNMGAQLVLEASETTNRLAGDGTTATVALSYQLMKHGAEAIACGANPMEIRETLTKDSSVLLKKLEEIHKPTEDFQLEQVATVSAGDPQLGQLIAGAVRYVGVDGGILTEKAHVQDIEREYVDGYYLQSGFTALPVGRKELLDPYVIVSIRNLSSAADAVDILNHVAKTKNLQPGEIPRVLFVGNIESLAYSLIVDNVNRGTLDAIILKAPGQYGEMSKQLLEDIALYAGCRPITDSTNLKDAHNHSYVGTVRRVVATKTDATIFASNETEAVQVRIDEIKDQLKTETTDAIAEKLRDRIAKLEGKIALFKIGGATDTEKEEKEFRVEDAIQATRAAASHGVVPGGGTTWIELSKCDVSDIYKNAMREVFMKLLSNANLDSSKLNDAFKASRGWGYNLRGNGELVDLVKAGVLDPKLVVEQVIKNATSIAGNALTVGTELIFEDVEEKK